MGLPPGRSAVEGLLRTGCGRGVAGLLLAVPLTVTLGGALVALGGALGAGPLPRVRPLLMVIGVATMFEYWSTIAPSLVPVEGLAKRKF